MKEEEKIATEKVLPELLKMGFQEKNISKYGSHPIKFGTSTIFADFVCSIGFQDEPYLVIEVKTSEKDFNLSQVESYAQRINAKFFSLTDGKIWKNYLTMEGQETSLKIDRIPMPDDNNYVNPPKKNDFIVEIEGKLVQAFNKENDWFINGLNWHIDSLEFINENLNDYQHYNKKLMNDFLLSPRLMNNRRNNFQIEQAIENDLRSVKKSLDYLQDKNIPLETKFDNLVSNSNEYHISGIGPTVISRLFASLTENCFTIDRKVLNQLVQLNIIPERISLTGLEYIKLMEKFSPLLKNKYVKEYGLEVIHYLLWSWNEILQKNN